MNYIKEMRELIGNKPLMLVGTSIIACIDGKVLLQKRADNGLWGYPGGCMEIFETPEESAKREFTEETGYIVKNIKLFGVFAGERRHYTYPNGHEVYITDIVYTCREVEKTNLSFDEEVLEIGWFPIDKLPLELTVTTEDVLERFKEKYYDNTL